MHDTFGVEVVEALWKFFIDAGGFPRIIQCDFDPRFIGSKAISLLWSHGCYVRAAPPHRQDQNRLVENFGRSYRTWLETSWQMPDYQKDSGIGLFAKPLAVSIFFL